jgi:hypothetical protein
MPQLGRARGKFIQRVLLRELSRHRLNCARQVILAILTMKTKRSLLTRALQERFIPILLKNGFTQLKLTGARAANAGMRRDFPFGYMTRPKGTDIELVDIQIHPRGKLKFVMNFGVAPPEGVELPWAKLEQHDMMASDLLRSCRLYDSRFYWRMKWFSVSWPSQWKDIEARINKTVDRLIEFYPAVEEWFSTQKEGPHVRCVELHFSSPKSDKP